MRPGRVVAIVVGVLLFLPALAMFIGGLALSVLVLVVRDDDGYFDADLDPIRSPTAAVTVEDIDLLSDPGAPDWFIEDLDATVRIRVTGESSELPVFVGIARQDELDGYLDGVARDQIEDMDGTRPEYRPVSGASSADPPVDEDLWVASASGTGPVELVWEPTSGRWAVALMNADGSAGIDARVEVGARVGVLGPLAAGLLVGGLVLLVIAVVLVVIGVTGPAAEHEAPPPRAHHHLQPVRVRGELDPDLSRGMWLVKWLLAIPHLLVLAALWLALLVVTVVAGIAILFTGRYPRSLFDFGVGVLRWSWRVACYAFGGGPSTDRYPPFRLGPDPGYPADLDVAYPEQLSRGLVLVKWWLLAIPHYLVLAVLVGGGIDYAAGDEYATGFGLLGILCLIGVIALLFTGRYPAGLHALIVGINRWGFRVAAYVLLMTDEYPPFRLDQGPDEPSAPDGAPQDDPAGGVATSRV